MVAYFKSGGVGHDGEHDVSDTGYRGKDWRECREIGVVFEHGLDIDESCNGSDDAE